jgi:hypothetical protein
MRASLVPPHDPGLARNAGVARATFDFVLFIDSDVTVTHGTIQAHYDALHCGADACAGLVKFTGRATFAWRAIYVMQFMLPFRYPLIADIVPWAPTANISFRKDRLLAVGAFDPTWPDAGGEDVDLGFRFSDAGLRIKACPRAVVHHTIETWAHWSQNLPRLATYGKADFYLIERHPSRTYVDVASPLLALIVQILLTIVITPVVGISSLLAFAGAIATEVLVYAFLKRRRGESLRTHVPGLFIISLLDAGKWIEACRHQRFGALFVRVLYLDDIIEQDWREIRAVAWGIYASTIAFVLVFVVEVLLRLHRSR